VHPIFIQIGDFAIRWFGVMMATGFLVAFFNMNYQAKREGLNQQAISDMLIWILVGGLMGARIAYVIANWPTEFASDPISMFYVQRGGLIYYGGLIGGIISSLIYVKIKKMSALSVADVAATSIPIGQAFGRVGCFLNGCCYGKVTAAPIGVEYPINSSPWIEQVNHHLIDSSSRCTLSVHPVQLYESCFSILIFLSLVFILRKQKFSGITASCYLLLYGILRFVMEFFRGDERQKISSITIAQGISLLIIAGGIVLFLYSLWYSKNKKKA
jgi:phosphatidylglycerol:prolipoprotein diacylglycerol transferase